MRIGGLVEELVEPGPGLRDRKRCHAENVRKSVRFVKRRADRLNFDGINGIFQINGMGKDGKIDFAL